MDSSDSTYNRFEAALLDDNIEDLLSVTLSMPVGQRVYVQALAQQYHKQQLLADFRQKLVDFVSETLNQGVGKDFYQRLLESAVSVIPTAQAGHLLVRNDDSYYYAATMNYPLQDATITEQLSAYELALIYAEVQPSVLRDVSSYPLPHIQHLLDAEVPLRVASSLVVPVVLGGRNVAFLSLDNFQNDNAFDNEAIAMAEAFAVQMAVVLKRFRLEATLRQRNKDIQETNEKLEQANRYKSDFLASMSHELRTPLTSIIGFGELVHEGTLGGLNDMQKDAVNDIIESGKHLLSLINDVLDLAKVEAGRMELVSEEMDLCEVIEESYRVMRERINNAELTITFHMPDEGAFLRGDRRKIKQVLLNLLSNAVKFTPEGGSITVAVQRLSASKAWRVLVRDTGIGISEKDKAKLFQEFSQLTPSSKSRGTGLGLAISRRFVELHGGYMEVKSQPGKGSVFSFVLPRLPNALNDPSVQMPEPKEVKKATKESPPHVIIVHSDAVTRSEIVGQLVDLPYQLVELSSGFEVLRWLEDYRPSLIISGFSLSDMSGMDILAQSKSRLPTLLLVPSHENVVADVLALYPSMVTVDREVLLEPEAFRHLVQRTILEARNEDKPEGLAS